MSQKPFNEWSTKDITSWIMEKLPGSGVLKQKACDAITENELTGADLMEATDKSTLKDINIPPLFANKLWNGIQRLKQTVKSNNNELSSEEVQNRTDMVSAIDDRLAQLLAENDSNLQTRSNNNNNNNNNSNNNNSRGFKVNIWIGTRQKKTVNYLYPHSTVLQLKEEIANTESGGEPTDLSLTCNSVSLVDNKTLEESGVNTHTYVRAVFRVHGGSNNNESETKYDNIKDNNENKGYFDNKNAIRKRFPRFKENKNIKPTLKPDCILGESDNDQNSLRVEMSCGHVFEPMTIFKLCQRSIQVHSKTEVCCPITKCNKQWEIHDIVCGADLNENEHLNLLRVLENRKLLRSGNYKECPGCKMLVEKPEEQYMLRVHCGAPECKDSSDFCWICGNNWVSDGMAVCGNNKCPTATVNESLKISNCGVTKSVLSRGDVECPKLRACPHCLTLVQYKDACKHMQCWSCNEYFCFICLSVAKRDENGYPKEWGCEFGDGHDGHCKLAPVQNID